jgi:hypothetical protein
MELSRHPALPARYAGLGLVTAVHAIALTALTLAFQKPASIPKGPIQFKPVIEQPDRPKQPPPPIRADGPVIRDVLVSPVPPTPLPTIEGRSVVHVEPLRTDAPPPATDALVRSAPSVVTAPHGTQAPMRRPGAVCTVMPRPELPALTWGGDAVLHALATVRGGRVVSSEIRVAQGAMDMKTRRALQRTVETALAGYQCAGDAMFEQEFAFRLD